MDKILAAALWVRALRNRTASSTEVGSRVHHPNLPEPTVGRHLLFVDYMANTAANVQLRDAVAVKSVHLGTVVESIETIGPPAVPGLLPRHPELRHNLNLPEPTVGCHLIFVLNMTVQGRRVLEVDLRPIALPVESEKRCLSLAQRQRREDPYTSEHA